VETHLTTFEGDPGRPPFAAHRDQIDKIFGADLVETILAGLESDGSEWAIEQRRLLATKSPQTLKVAHRQLRLGAQCANFAENMRMEYRIAARVVRRPDFQEGVRAILIDKDNAPSWNPATLAEVSEALLDEIFAPLPAAQEWSPLP
jgi:enoyl-CoA hydratase